MFIHRIPRHLISEKRTFHIDKLSPVLPRGLFQKFVIPELFKIFHVRDCYVRLVILKHFGAYFGLFDRPVLQSVILPQVRQLFDAEIDPHI